MTAAMDSPERNPIVPTTDLQASPLFHFLCSLSPIKPIKSGHTPQTFSELSFPPPPPVFVSPKGEARREFAVRSKRKLLTANTEETKVTVERNCNSAELSSTKNTGDMNDGASSLIQVTNCNENSSIESTIAVPCDGNLISPCGNNVSIQQLSCTSGLEIQATQTGSQETMDSTLTHSEFSSVATDKKQDKSIQSMSSVYLQSAAKFSHKPEEDNNDSQDLVSSLSDVPIEQHLSRILSSMQGILADGNQTISKYNTDILQSSYIPSSMLNDAELQAQSEQQVCRASTTGVRRRCLDFEALEAQKRELDNLPMLRMMGIGSDNLSSNVLPTTITDNIDLLRSKTTASIDECYSQFSMQGSTFESAKGAPYMQSSSTLISRDCHRGVSLSRDSSAFGYHSDTLGSNTPLMQEVHGNSTNGAVLPLSSSMENSAALVALNSLIKSSAGVSDMLSQDRIASFAEMANIGQRSGSNLANSVPSYQSLAFGIDLLGGNFNLNTLNGTHAGSSHSGDKRLIFQEISHQSESDHAEDSAHSPSSPKKKRKLSTQNGDNQGEGCKNCKCKKSKCLKLYCECFAAGVYCIDSCNCQDCFNKPEYEETVLGTRQQIESRNPLAFVPKIIRTTDTSPILMGEECNDTPASARHKKGCHCKKSQCLKKYCECYQAGVGCHEGCRCEGCKNIFGRNEGSGEADDKDQQTSIKDEKATINNENLMMETKCTPEHTAHQSTGLSPVTPYLAHSGQRMPNTEPGSSENYSSQFSLPLPTISFRSPSRLFESLESTPDTGQLNANSNVASKLTDCSQLLAGWDGLNDIFTMSSLSTPLNQFGQVMPEMFLDKTEAWPGQDLSIPGVGSDLPALTSPESTQACLIQQLVPLLFPSDTYQFHCPESAPTVPETPLLTSSTLVSHRNYDLEEMLDTPPQQPAWFGNDDNSPPFLKETNAFVAPDIILKTRSPQQKRVLSRSSSLREIISPGSGLRKFILHSLPSSSCQR